MLKVLLIIFWFLSLNSNAQLQTLDVTGSGPSHYGSVKYNNALTIGQAAPKIDYAEVRGRYFWNEDWNPAIVILKGGNSLKMTQAKLNLYTNEIHYIDNVGAELVAQAGLIRQITMYSRSDSGRVMGVFRGFIGLTKDSKEHYFQVLNDGKIQLLKLTVVKVLKGQYDPSLATYDYSFSSSTSYFLKEVNSINPLKALSKASIFSALRATPESEAWLLESKNKLKNEESVIAYLNWLNFRN